MIYENYVCKISTWAKNGNVLNNNCDMYCVVFKIAKESNKFGERL